jgi:hypothetical protein
MLSTLRRKEFQLQALVINAHYQPILQDGRQTLCTRLRCAHPQPAVHAVGGHFADNQTQKATLLDRLLHHAHIVQVSGESYRLATNAKPNRQQG